MGGRTEGWRWGRSWRVPPGSPEFGPGPLDAASRRREHHPCMGGAVCPARGTAGLARPRSGPLALGPPSKRRRQGAGVGRRSNPGPAPRPGKGPCRPCSRPGAVACRPTARLTWVRNGSGTGWALLGAPHRPSQGRQTSPEARATDGLRASAHAWASPPCEDARTAPRSGASPGHPRARPAGRIAPGRMGPHRRRARPSRPRPALPAAWRGERRGDEEERRRAGAVGAEHASGRRPDRRDHACPGPGTRGAPPQVHPFPSRPRWSGSAAHPPAPTARGAPRSGSRPGARRWSQRPRPAPRPVRACPASWSRRPVATSWPTA